MKRFPPTQFVAVAAVLITAIAVPAFRQAQAQEAHAFADRIQTADSRADVISKIGRNPSSSETGRYLGFLEVETLSFRIGLREKILVRLVLGKVVSVETLQITPWELLRP